jgi:hypothetical protein
MATMSASLRNNYDAGLAYEYGNPHSLSHSDSDPGPSHVDGLGLDGGYGNRYAGPSHQNGMQQAMPRHAMTHHDPSHPSHPPRQSHSLPVPLSAGFEHLTNNGSIPPMSHPYINTHPSNPNHPQQHPYNSFQPAAIPGSSFPPQHLPPQYSTGLPPGPNHAMPPPGFAFGQPPPRELWPNHGDWDDERDYIDGQDVIYGQLEVSPVASSYTLVSPPSPLPLILPSHVVTSPLLSHVQGHQHVKEQYQDPLQGRDTDHFRFPSVPPPSTPSPQQIKRQFPLQWQRNESDGFKVKHRRRTTPEQLKVLEHWFDVNPKPDNNLREWLAVELGMTKRNIQVWFQNRQVGFFPSLPPCLHTGEQKSRDWHKKKKQRQQEPQRMPPRVISCVRLRTHPLRPTTLNHPS